MTTEAKIALLKEDISIQTEISANNGANVLKCSQKSPEDQESDTEKL